VKVLHLGKFDTLGGIERHVKALASGLAATEGTVVINLVSSNSRHSEHHLRYGYPTIAAASWGTLFSVALSPSLPALARKLQREARFDIVHLHFPDPLGHLTALCLPRAVKRVISWHSDIIRQHRALMVYGPFVRRFIADADAVIGATPQHLASPQIPPASLRSCGRWRLTVSIPRRWRGTLLPIHGPASCGSGLPTGRSSSHSVATSTTRDSMC
jgi:glycosyltransferase involved in cell wall biosynthesis